MIRRIVFIVLLVLISPGLKSQTVPEILHLIRHGQLEQAESMLEQMGNMEKESESILFLQGLVTTRADSAILMYELLLEKYPHSQFTDDARFRLGLYNYAKGLYRAAKKHFHQLIMDHPKSRLLQKTYYWIGQCHLAVDEKDSAEHFLRIAMAKFPKNTITDLAMRDLEKLKPASQTKKTGNSTQSDITQSEPANNNLQYYVQVGAFSIQTSANLRKSYFERLGYQVKIKSKRKNTKRLYLVWIGSYNNENKAKTVAEKIKTDHSIQYLIVQE